MLTRSDIVRFLFTLTAVILLTSNPTNTAASTNALPTPDIVMPCSYVSPDGVRYENLIEFRQSSFDYEWVGWDELHENEWKVDVNFCANSNNVPKCRQQWGSVCLTNLTSTSLHPPNETWPTDMIIGGRTGQLPVPTFSLIDSENPDAGLKMVYHNGDKPMQATMYLHCIENADFVVDIITSVIVSPNFHTLEFHLASTHACPTYYPPPPFRLKPWHIVLICVGALIALYVIGGCMYKSLVHNTQGCDSFPNIQMWRRLPLRISHCCSSMCTYISNGCRRDSDLYAEL